MAGRIKLFPWMAIMLVISAMALVWALSRFYMAYEYRQQLAQGVLGNSTTPHVLFANAVRLNGQGQTAKALAAYAAVIAQDDIALRQAAYYNSGNLYLSHATHLLETEGLPAWDEAGPLIALAKESYQKALRLHPGWSEAKYNYQLALRLAPSTYAMQGPQRYEDELINQDQDPTGWPAMPGNPRGMP